MNSSQRTSLILATLISVSFSANSQTYQPKTITFKGDPEYTTAELLEAAQFKKGASISVNEMNAKSQLLLDSGVLSAVEYKFNGQDLVFTISPASQLLPLRLENFPLTPGPDLDKRLHAHLPLYHGLVPVKGDVLEGVKQGLADELAPLGIHATIAATPYTELKLHKVTAMSFTITDPEVQIGDITLQGVSPAFADKAKAAETKSVGSAYDAEGSPSQIETTLHNLYGEQGYLQVKVSAAPLPTPVVSKDSVRIPFTVTVQEGPIFKIGKINLAPDMLVAQAAFDKIPGIHPGDVASLSKLRGSWESILREYHNRGYLTAEIKPEPSYDTAQATVNYAVSVSPGQVYTMGKLKVQNVSDDLRTILTNAWKLKPGDIFNESLSRGFVAIRGKDPALERVITNFNLSFTRRMNDENHTVDITMTAEPKHP